MSLSQGNTIFKYLPTFQNCRSPTATVDLTLLDFSPLSTEFEVELVATVLVGVLLLVSAGIAVFILYKFRKSQDNQAGGE